MQSLWAWLLMAAGKRAFVDSRLPWYVRLVSSMSVAVWVMLLTKWLPPFRTACGLRIICSLSLAFPLLNLIAMVVIPGSAVGAAGLTGVQVRSMSSEPKLSTSVIVICWACAGK